MMINIIQPVKPKGIAFRVPMNDEQFSEVRSLTKQWCANYDSGNCLPLDKKCVQMECNDGLCNYFKESVLPLDNRLSIGLGQAFTQGDKHKACINCGELFITTNYKIRLCEKCRNSNNKDRYKRYNQKRG